MSLRSCCVVLGDQDGWGTNRLSKAESILGDWDVPKSITRPKTRLQMGEYHAGQRKK